MSNKQKKKKVKKPQNRENDKCNCKHPRIYHYGISGVCYHLKCDCVNFRLKDSK